MKERSDGHKGWYLNGKSVTEEEVMKEYYTKDIRKMFDELIRSI